MDIKSPVRVRMAPSPTGYLHIGGARTALFNYLFAKHYGGQFILRIEDTDKERSKKEYEEAIIKDLQWLGVDWDEGPLKGGPYRSYYQSQRGEIYEKYKKILIEKERVYDCYCTPEDLERERKELLKNKQTPRYRGRCRDLTDEEKTRLRREGREPVLRYRVDETAVIEMRDLIRGTVRVDPCTLGDFVIAKADGGPVYNFASVVDDYEMKISHVIRGEEHISNTPRQMLLSRALGFEPPAYAHVSIILAPDRTKLSKRHGATSLGDYQQQGFLPEALFNYLSLLGWNPGDEREIMDRDEIVKSFTIDRMIASPAVFDAQKLTWMNSVYIRKKPIADMVARVLPFLKKSGFQTEGKDPKWLEGVVDAVRGSMERMDQIGEHADLFFDEKFSLDEEAEKKLKQNRAEAIEVLTALDGLLSRKKSVDERVFEELQAELRKKLDVVPPKILFQTQRLALTGRLKGPEMVLVVPILGVASCRKRIEATLSKLK